MTPQDKLLELQDLNSWTNSFLLVSEFIDGLYPGEQVAISLKGTFFLRPPGVMMLFLVARVISKRTSKPVKVCDMGTSVFQYLDRIDFFKFPFVYTDQVLPWWAKLTRGKSSSSIIEITHLTGPAEIALVIEKTRGILRKWFPVDTMGKYSDSAANVLMEICGNSIEHSVDPGQPAECYFTLQHYSYPTGKMEIAISTGDIGMGIRQHLMKAHNINKSDVNCIRQALQGLSGRLDGTGGMGFQRVRQITSNYNGDLLVRSGAGAVRVSNDKFYRYDIRGTFPGTQCSINLHPDYEKTYLTMGILSD